MTLVERGLVIFPKEIWVLKFDFWGDLVTERILVVSCTLPFKVAPRKPERLFFCVIKKKDKSDVLNKVIWFKLPPYRW